MTTWVLRHSAKFNKSLSKLDPQTQRKISRYLSEILYLDDPRIVGAGLSGNLAGYWRYRVGDYRIFVQIVENELIVIALDVGHRSKIYRR